MTTERKRPRLDLTGLEWKLLLTTLLAGGWTAAWLGLDVPSAPAPAQPTFASARPVPQKAVRPRIKTRSS